MSARVTAIVLAGRLNTGAFKDISPEPFEALIDIAGRPMVSYVVDALIAAPGVGRIIVVGPQAHLAGKLEGVVEVVEHGAGLVENLGRGLAAAGAGPGAVDAGAGAANVPFLILGSDIPLITADVIERFLEACRQVPAFFHYPIVERSICIERFPDVRRTFVRVRDGVFTGGNVFLVRREAAPRLLDLVGSFFAARKSPLRLAGLLGWRTVFRFLTRRAAIAELEGVFTRLAAVPCRAVIFPHPEIGIDVDKPGDLELVRAHFSR